MEYRHLLCRYPSVYKPFIVNNVNKEVVIALKALWGGLKFGKGDLISLSLWKIISIIIMAVKKFMTEFKEFAVKGNVVDLAVGVIIGAAFGKIVSSLVNDVLMPVIGYFTGGVNFSEHRWVIQQAVTQGEEIITPEIALSWGVFVQAVVDFIIVAFCIFCMVKFIIRLRNRKEEEVVEETAPEPSDEVKLLTEIRDLLKQQENK